MTVMSATSNRIELADPAEYKRRLIARLKGRPPLEVLAETPAIILNLARSAPADLLRRRPFSERWTWTPCEVLGHVCDTEIVFGYRGRAIYCDDRPTIIGMDQDKWVAAQKYNERDPVELAVQFGM